MKRFLIIISIVCLTIESGVGQINSDSLWGIWNSTESSDSLKLKAIHKLSWNLRKSDPDSCRNLANLELILANENKDTAAILGAINALAFADYYQKNLDSAAKLFKSGIEIATTPGFELRRGQFTYQLARIKRDKGEFEEARELYIKSNEILKGIAGDGWIGDAWDHVAAISTNLGQLSRSLEEYTISAKYHRSSKDTLSWAKSLNNLGIIYRRQGNYDEAIKHFEEGLRLKQLSGDEQGIANSLLNLGNVHQDRNAFDESIDFFQRSYDHAKKINFVQGEARALTNIGTSLKLKGNLKESLSQYKEALSAWNQTDLFVGTSNTLNNLAILHAEMGMYPEGLDYCEKAFQLSSAFDYKYGTLVSKINEGHIRSKLNDCKRAITSYSVGLEMARETGYVAEIRDAAEGLYECYSKTGEFKKSLEMHELFIEMRDSISQDEIEQAVMRQEFQHKLETQALADSLDFVTMESAKNLLIHEQIDRINIQRITLGLGTFGTLLILLLAFSIYNGKKKSERLLLNILPEPIAAELKDKGHSDAKQFESVSVIFTDFKGFTEISEKLSPKDLVAEIDEVFSAFDQLIDKYGLEKIKTIGDAYMAAGGLPVPNKTHPKDVVTAAMEIRDYMTLWGEMKRAEGKPHFQIRIGIHTGPVVAGIVGTKKFQYDIWGDAVNIAARIESSGEVGKINISEATYELLKDDPQFSFERRGKIKAKGKGELEMFFVDQA